VREGVLVREGEADGGWTSRLASSHALAHGVR